MNDMKYVTAVDGDGNIREKTTINIGGTAVGRDFTVIAGPCSIESAEQITKTALAVKAAGANMLRGGAYKPRTSPYSFQGLGKEGLVLLREAGKAAGLATVTEVVDTRDVELVCEYADVLQIGTRNMQNYSLLIEAGKSGKPVLLKRGMHATLEEWLLSAEYILCQGNPNVILCERGIKTFETYTRNTLDLSAVAALKSLTHLPVIVDPSHATGRREMIPPMAISAVVAGCDGLEIEVHPSPSDALSDACQQLTPEQFGALMTDVRRAVRFREELSCRL